MAWIAKRGSSGSGFRFPCIKHLGGACSLRMSPADFLWIHSLWPLINEGVINSGASEQATQRNVKLIGSSYLEYT